MAFAKYYWSESSRAAHVADTSTIERLYEPECDVCQEFVDLVNKDKKKGLRTSIDATTIHEAKVTDDTNERSDQAVTLIATDAEYELIDNSGEPVARVEQLDYRLIVYVDWQDSSWTVVDSYMFT